MIDFLFNSTPVYFMTQSLWRDEALTYLLAKKSILDIIAITARDFNPPFYYIILHFWVGIFGKSEVVMRTLSLIFFALTVYVIFLFLESIIRVDGKRKWIYVLLFVFSPGLLYYAFEARMYALFALLTLLSCYFFLRKKQKKYLLVSIAGFYTHYFFIFVIATQTFYNVIRFKKNFFKKSSYLCVPFLFFLPWVLYIYPTITSQTKEFLILTPTISDLIASVGVLFTGYEPFYHYYDYFIIPLSLLLIFLVVFLSYRYRIGRGKNNGLFAFLILWSFLFYIIIFIVSFFKPIFHFRYLIFASVGFNLLLFFLLEHIPRKLFRIIISILLFITIHYTALEVSSRRKGNIRKIISEIKIIAHKKDFIYVAEPALYFPVSYYFDEKRVFIYDRPSMSHYIDVVLIPQNKIIFQLPTYPQRAFILKDDSAYEIKSIR